MAAVPEPRGGALPADELPRMSLLDHLEDLRKRIVYSALALLVAMLGCFNWAPEICRFFARPIYERHLLPEGQKLAFLGVTDAFLLYFKTALLAGAFLAAPVIATSRLSGTSIVSCCRLCSVAPWIVRRRLDSDSRGPAASAAGTSRRACSGWISG